MLTRLSEWTFYTHVGLAGVFAVVLGVRLDLRLELAVGIWLAATLVLTLGLLRPRWAIVTAVAGTAFATVVGAFVTLLFCSAFLGRLLPPSVVGPLCVVLGGLVAAGVSIERYRPFLRARRPEA